MTSTEPRNAYGKYSAPPAGMDTPNMRLALAAGFGRALGAGQAARHAEIVKGLISQGMSPAAAKRSAGTWLYQREIEPETRLGQFARGQDEGSGK